MGRIKDTLKRGYNRSKRKGKRLKKLRPSIKLHTILLILITLKLYKIL